MDGPRKAPRKRGDLHTITRKIVEPRGTPTYSKLTLMPFPSCNLRVIPSLTIAL